VEVAGDCERWTGNNYGGTLRVAKPKSWTCGTYILGDWK
jgi:hypothetical protein